MTAPFAPIKATSQFVFVRFQKEGIHAFFAAGTDSKYKTGGADDVSFLGYPHRHMFHFTVFLEVQHNDRDVEFIQFKRELEALYAGGALDLNHKSCEMMAEELAGYIRSKYPARDILIEIAEDGENGASMAFLKDNEVLEQQ